LVLRSYALFPLLFATALPAPLAKWKADIEATGKTTIVLARVFTDTTRNELVLPEDTEFRPILSRLLASSSFVQQFVQTHAMNVNAKTGVRPVSVVFLNMARSGDWEGQEDAVVAHEFGHIWLHAQGYQAPQSVGGLSCEAVHAGDIVQHVLIREQMRTRGIDYLPFWIRSLNTALDHLNDTEQAAADPCQRISRLALWVDVELGLTDKQWPRRQALLAAFRRHFHDLGPRADTIASALRRRNLHDRRTYQATMQWVLVNISSPRPGL
jgi:hypothetical protein